MWRVILGVNLIYWAAVAWGVVIFKHHRFFYTLLTYPILTTSAIIYTILLLLMLLLSEVEESTCVDILSPNRKDINLLLLRVNHAT